MACSIIIESDWYSDNLLYTEYAEFWSWQKLTPDPRSQGSKSANSRKGTHSSAEVPYFFPRIHQAFSEPPIFLLPQTSQTARRVCCPFQPLSTSKRPHLSPKSWLWDNDNFVVFPARRSQVQDILPGGSKWNRKLQRNVRHTLKPPTCIVLDSLRLHRHCIGFPERYGKRPFHFNAMTRTLTWKAPFFCESVWFALSAGSLSWLGLAQGNLSRMKWNWIVATCIITSEKAQLSSKTKLKRSQKYPWKSGLFTSTPSTKKRIALLKHAETDSRHGIWAEVRLFLLSWPLFGSPDACKVQSAQLPTAAQHSSYRTDSEASKKH